MTDTAFDMKRLKVKHSPKELNDLLTEINLKIDSQLPALYKYVTTSRWNEVNTELEEFNKTVQ